MGTTISKTKACIIAICAFVILVGFFVYDNIQTDREIMLSMDDAVYEYIYNKLGDGCTDSQIVSYYNRHRKECMDIEYQNKISE